MHQVLRFLGKTVLGLCLFYALVGFVIVPLVLLWAVPSQGAKALKAPVHLRFAWFNPFMLQLTLKGFDVLDRQNQPMVAFDRLFVDVSFLDLWKKKYHVEDFQLDGLKINAELLPDKRINLLQLAPAATAGPSPKTTTASPSPKASWPVIIIHRIGVHKAQIHFQDLTVKPAFSSRLDDMELTITNITTDPEDQAEVDFKAHLDEKGIIIMHAAVKPLAQPLEMETTFKLNDYALDVLTPYCGKYAGHVLKSGKLDLRMDYRIGGRKLTATHRLLIQRFEFGHSVESKDALHLPFGLAIALLEDPDGRINIALPVTGDMSSPKFQYGHLIVQVVRNFFLNLVTRPFSFLASQLGSTEFSMDELGYVNFTPGKTDLSPAEMRKLAVLIQGLKQHPKLLLKINGPYDPQVDWRANQADTFQKDYEQLRKITSRPETTVYQMLYQQRFGIRGLWALSRKYKQGMGTYDEAKLDAEIKRQLIEHAPPDPVALGALAAQRAKQVNDFLLLNGFDVNHLSQGRPEPVQSSMGHVPLQLTLTVFEKE